MACERRIASAVQTRLEASALQGFTVGWSTRGSCFGRAPIEDRAMHRWSGAALDERKQALRREARTFRRSLAPQVREARSRAICGHIQALAEWTRADTIAVYDALPHEVDLRFLVQDAPHKQLFWPVVEGRTAPLVFRAGPPTVRGAFGVFEPPAHASLVALGDVDLVVVPGLAFDALGRRLGQGGGFYDRTLTRMRALRLAVCFREQVVSEVPAGAHDCRMDLVVHDGAVLRMPTRNR